MLRGHVFSEQVFGVDIFALFINQFLGGHNGIVQSYKNAMAMTNTSNSIEVDTGVCVIQGRYVEEHTGSVINYAKTDNLYCSLVIEIDLGRINTRTSLEQLSYKILEGENDYPILIQNDIINQTGNIYQFELARFQNGATGIINFTDRRSYLSFDSVYSGIIQDNLESDSSTSALSAKQGKVLDEKIDDIFDKVYPIGSIYMSVNSTNPSSLFGGTWVAWGTGRVPVGINTSDTNFNTVEKTGGEKTHTLTVNEMPSHKHKADGTTPAISYYHAETSGDGFVVTSGSSSTSRYLIKKRDETGGGQAHNNLQPYITCYMWKRTA